MEFCEGPRFKVVLRFISLFDFASLSPICFNEDQISNVSLPALRNSSVFDLTVLGRFIYFIYPYLSGIGPPKSAKIAKQKRRLLPKARDKPNSSTQQPTAKELQADVPHADLSVGTGPKQDFWTGLPFSESARSQTVSVWRQASWREARAAT